METWEMLDEDTYSEDSKEEAKYGSSSYNIVVTTSSSKAPSSNSIEDDEVIFERICNVYIPSIKRLLKLHMNKSRSLKNLKKKFNFLSEELKPLKWQNHYMPKQNLMLRELLSLDENDIPSPKSDSSSEESSDVDFDRSRLASISSNVSKNKEEEC
jgi:hypothetical protein